MNVETGAEDALFPEKEYINGIAVAVQPWQHLLGGPHQYGGGGGGRKYAGRGGGYRY